MSSITQVLVSVLCLTVLTKGEGQTKAAIVNPTVAGYTAGQWPGSQYSWQGGNVAGTYGSQGWKMGTSWPYNQGYLQEQYRNTNPYNNNAYGNNAFGQRFNTFGSQGYPNNMYGYNNQGGSYNPAYGNKYNAVQTPGYGRPWSNVAGAYNNPYNTPWMNAYSQNGFGTNNVYANYPYNNNPYKYNPGVSTAIPTTTPKYNTFGTTGFSGAYNPSAFGSTGYGSTGYNSIGYGATGLGYNNKYGTGYKPWMRTDGKFPGYQGIAASGYRTDLTLPAGTWNQYGTASTGYAQ